MTCYLRPCEIGDVPWLLQCIKALAEFEEAPEYCTATEEDYKTYLFGETTVANCIIAEWEGQRAGLTLYFQDFSAYIGCPGIFIEDIYVDPVFRRKGIARQLMDYVVNEAKAKGMKRVRLMTLHSNESARKLYAEYGNGETPEALVINLEI